MFNAKDPVKVTSHITKWCVQDSVEHKCWGHMLGTQRYRCIITENISNENFLKSFYYSTWKCKQISYNNILIVLRSYCNSLSHLCNIRCKNKDVLSVICGCRSRYWLFVMAILRLKFPHVLVRILQVVVAHFFQDLLQVHLINKENIITMSLE